MIFLIIQVGPKSNKMCPFKKRRRHQEEGYVKTEAKIEVLYSQAKDSQRLLAATRSCKRRME